MNADRRPDPLLAQLLADTDEAATAALFMELCRASPPLCRWLWDDFAREERTRTAFALRLKRSGEAAPRRIAELSAPDTGRATELAALRRQFPGRIYGGRTWHEIEAVVAQLRAGRADLGAFLLALQWHRAGAKARHSAILLRAAATFLEDVLTQGHRSRLAQLGAAAELVRTGTRPATRRTSVAFGDWWKLQLLLHLLRNPRPSYRTREMHAHLAAAGLRVDPREIRRFCIRHGIARDVRGGRPRLPPVARKRAKRR